MSKNELHTEENFWPCVSDMFLALFVIALALYAAMSNENGKGERRFAELAAKETNLLLKDLDMPLYSDEEKAKDAESVNTRRSCPKLAAKLLSVLQNEEVVEIIKNSGNYRNAQKTAGVDDMQVVLATLGNPVDGDSRQITVDFSEGAENDYREVVALLARALDLQPIPRNDPAYDRHIEAIHHKLISLATTVEVEDPEVVKLRLSNAEAENMHLKAANAELKDELTAKELRIRELEKRIAMLEKSLEALRKSLDNKDREIARLNAEIERLKKEHADKRRNVMKRVDALTREYGLVPGVDYVIVEEEGILRIPSSSVSFESNKATFSNPHSANEKMWRIGRLLNRIAVENDNPYNKELYNTISNIVLEAHADVRRTTDYKGGNEELSSLRALFVWQKVSENNDLSAYRSLFSHAGFGDRVLLERYSYETEESWCARCRRIDIRFICTPEIKSK